MHAGTFPLAEPDFDAAAQVKQGVYALEAYIVRTEAFVSRVCCQRRVARWV